MISHSERRYEDGCPGWTQTSIVIDTPSKGAALPLCYRALEKDSLGEKVKKITRTFIGWSLAIVGLTLLVGVALIYIDVYVEKYIFYKNHFRANEKVVCHECGNAITNRWLAVPVSRNIVCDDCQKLKANAWR